jgi:hypothetical protein
MPNKIEVIAIDKDLQQIDSCVIDTVEKFAEALPIALDFFDAKDKEINAKACGYIYVGLYPIMGNAKNPYR